MFYLVELLSDEYSQNFICGVNICLKKYSIKYKNKNNCLEILNKIVTLKHF